MLALMLPCLGAMAQIQSSTSTDAPEHLYKIKSKNGIYMAAHSNPTQTNYGRFAFYAVDGKENTYKIYSYDANLWLTYTKASGYNNGMNFVSFAQTQESANEWYVESVGNYYQVAPYNNSGVAGKYWNFFGGINSTYYSYDDYKNTLGLYQNGAASDNGSAWTFEDVDANDYAAPTAINYEVTDGNGYVYTGTYTGVAGRTRIFTKGNTLCPITNVTFEDNTYKANIAIPFHTSGVVISSFNGNDIRFAVKEGKEIATKTVPTTTEIINNYLWNIHPSFANNTLTFSIEHVETGKFLHTTATSRAHDDGTITLADEGTQFVYVANNGFKYGNLWLSTNSSNPSEQCLGLWDSQHDGAKHLIHKVNNYTITDAAGNVYEGEFNGYDLKNEAFLPTFTGVERYTLSDKAWSGYNFSATIDFNLPFEVSSDTTTNLISIGQGTWSNQDAYAKLWTVVGNNVKVVNGTPTLGTAQWMVYPTLNGTKFGFKIKSATGKYVTANPESNADPTAINTPITLTENGTAFQFINTGIAGTNGFAYTNNGGTTLFITSNGESDNNAPLGVFGSNESHKGNGVRFPEFNQYQVVIGEAGYTTIYSPFTALTNDYNNNGENLQKGNVVEIYTIAEEANYNEEKNEWKVPLVQASYYIPANGAAILKGKGTFVFTQMAEEDRYPETDAIWANNNLKGSSVNTYVAEDAYILSAPGDVENIGLYIAELNMNEAGEKVGEQTGTRFLNNAGKAYILAKDLFPTTPLGTSGKVRFSFGGETTAIESVLDNSVDTNAPIYDLSGRRVVNAVKGGIYIQNGKKVYIK